MLDSRVYRGRRIDRLRANREAIVVLDSEPQLFTSRRVIVGEEYPNLVAQSSTSTSVPSPGFETTRSPPPTAVARSFIARSP